MLTHMLMLDDRYSPKFGAFLGAVSSGMSSEQAFSSIYGKTFDQVTKDLRAYFSANSLKGVLFDARLEKIAVSAPKPAPDFDVELTLARLAGITGKREEAQVRLERLAAAHADRWEPWEALGQVAWRKNDRAAAAKYLKRAVDMNPPAWTVYWDYVRLASPSDSAAIIPALQRLLQLNGSLTDARMMLGYELYTAERYKEALQVYKTIRSVDAERAPRLFLGMAHSAARAGEWSDAEAAAAAGSEVRQKSGRCQQCKATRGFSGRPQTSSKTIRALEVLSALQGKVWTAL